MDAKGVRKDKTAALLRKMIRTRQCIITIAKALRSDGASFLWKCTGGDDIIKKTRRPRCAVPQPKQVLWIDIFVHMEKKHFKKLVIAGFLKSLTLSITGLIDCAVVGLFIGVEGLSAFKLAMPVYSMLALFSALFSGGLSVMIARELSEHGVKRANEVFQSAFTVICAVGACITVVGAAAPGVFSDLFAGLSCDPQVKAQTTEYLRPILLGALPILLYDSLGTVAMLDGGTRYLKLSSVVLFLADIAGDLLAVRLRKGMCGVAAASTAAYTAALAVILLSFFSKKSMLRPGLCRPDRAALRDTLRLGMPVVFMLFCNILRPLAVNRCVLTYGTMIGLAALSIQDAIRYVPAALCSGIAKASLILAGIFTAESDLLALRQEKLSIMRWSYIGGTVVALILMLLSSPLLWLFTGDPAVHSMGVWSLLLYLPGVPFIAISMSIISLLQGMGDNRRSISFTVFSHLISPVFFAWLLGRRFGDLGIYASFTVSEIFVAVAMTSLLLLRKFQNRTIIPSSLLNADVKADLKLVVSDPEQAVSASKQMNTVCLENGVSEKQAFLMALTAEELAMNSLTHGFRDRKAHYLELRLIITGDTLVLRLRDDGRPFDLTERYKLINPDDPTHNIGLRIIFASADEVFYNSALNLNNVCIKVNRETAVVPSRPEIPA